MNVECSKFHPTFLYIKRHKKTGALYFGKTIRTDIEKYNGSGIRWKNHIKEHGLKEIETLWYCLTEELELVKFATQCSALWGIVESEIWLNLIPENGLCMVSGIKFSDEHKRKIKIAKNGAHKNENNPFYGKKHTPESIKKMSIAQSGSNNSQFGKSPSQKHRDSISRANSGKKRTAEMNLKNSQRNMGFIMAFDLELKKNVRISKTEFLKLKGIKYVGITSKLAKT